ncbi:hypothetical protein PC39_04542 [Salinisphaera sp. PC39]|uniref:DUF1329 domain-containing protein n=1 Tax=Salinisphaera sp. PC39 TaxID=1304156 RepID=UPI00333FA2DB
MHRRPNPAPGALALALALLLAVPDAVQAQQYRTQIRKVPDEAAEQVDDRDLEARLDELEDPYAKAMTLRHLAGRYARDGNRGKARDYLEQALALDALSAPATVEMRSHLAQLHAAAGDHRKVIETLEPILDDEAAVEELSARTWLALGNAHANLGQWDQAVGPLQRASEAGTRDEALYRLQLAVAMEAGRLDSAADALRRLLELAPDNKTYWMQLAAVHSQRGAHPEAVAALEVARHKGMLTTPEDRLQWVRAQLASGNPFDAARRLGDWMQAGDVPVNGDTWRLLATAWTEAEEIAKAVDPLRRAADATGDPQLYAQLGQLHMDLAQWQRAAAAFDRALAGGLGERAGPVLLSQGLAYYQQQRTQQARAAFERARRHGRVAHLAEQWVRFLEARPEGLAPLEIAGLAGSGGGEYADDAAPGADGETADSAVRGGAASAPMPASVPDTGDRWTPVGAVRAGNDDGTIPPWRGGLTPADAPEGYESGERLRDPFPDDEPRFVITADNYKRYADLLSAGHRAMFERYEDYRMPVYPTRRSAAFPEAIYRATLANQKRARLETPDALVGARLGFPFRRPENGVEAMWNHRLRYRSNDIWVRSHEAVVDAEGDYTLLERVEEVLFGYGNLARPEGMNDNIIAYYLAYLQRDGRSQGTVLAHETLDRRRSERRIWVSVPGTSRLFRVPPVGYDNPRPSTDGLMFVDQIDMYNGAYDRYVWKLQGRRELIVPYNAYPLHSGEVEYDELLDEGFPDPEYTRYERHRVWVVEASERGGASHRFGTRVFYIDEDSWSILLVENYDHAGRLWRFQEGHAAQYYDLQLTYTAPAFIYDLKDGRYLATRLVNEGPPIRYNTGRYEPVDFRPAAVRRRIR